MRQCLRAAVRCVPRAPEYRADSGGKLAVFALELFGLPDETSVFGLQVLECGTSLTCERGVRSGAAARLRATAGERARLRHPCDRHSRRAISISVTRWQSRTWSFSRETVPLISYYPQTAPSRTLATIHTAMPRADRPCWRGAPGTIPPRAPHPRAAPAHPRTPADPSP